MSGSLLSQIAPWITTALTGGPVGLAVKAATTVASALGLGSSDVASVTSVLSSSLSPEQKLALSNAENSFKLQMQQAGYADLETLTKLDLDQISTINATMVAELQNSVHESWLQKNWRPLCGVSVALGSFLGTTLCCLVFGIAIFLHDTSSLGILPTLASSLALLLSVPGAAVGIVAWHKGKAEVATASNTTSGGK